MDFFNLTHRLKFLSIVVFEVVYVLPFKYVGKNGVSQYFTCKSETNLNTGCKNSESFN